MKRNLIIHVGMEKTGSSSIQYTAKNNVDPLKHQGIYYLGLMLEEYSDRLFPWQHIRGWNDLHNLEQEQANRELVHVFNELNTQLSEHYHTLIWSNESLFNSVNFFNLALPWLIENFNVQILGYVRKPDAWIQSAYLQWGIKHKSYSGPLQPFNHWVEGKAFPVIDFIQKWDKYSTDCFFYNFDEINNIAEHFFHTHLALESGSIELIRKNDTPTPAQLALFALYNSSYQGEVLPYRLEDLFAKNAISSDTQELKELSNLVPNQEDLDAYCESTSSKLDMLKQRLNTQSTVSWDESVRLKSLTYDQNAINLELLKLCLSLHERVNELEKSTTN